tara:strand:+ start:1691 stop:1882 length:192 start_codon:yes stop_codon:yes gene_type:complete
MDDEQNDKTAELRGFKPLKPFKRRIILKKGNKVYFQGSEYRVLLESGKPVLSKVISTRKGTEG